MSRTFIPGLRFRSHAQELWAIVVESFQGWESRLNEASAAAGLSPVSAWVLIQIDPDHPISQKDLAARLRCNPSTVVDPTDRLEDGGLVTRRPNASDRRRNVLTVTSTGRQIRDELLEQLFEPPDAFRKLASRDQVRFRDAMLAAVADLNAPAREPRRPRSRRVAPTKSLA